MAEKELSPDDKERKFREFLVTEYLKHGSVDEVFRVHRYDLPISYPGYHHLLDKWDIVKAAGPNSKLTEALEFLTHLAEENIPLEALYKKMPPSFKTSMATMHRILSYIKEGVTRRVGTALIITPETNHNEILIGNDVSTPRLELGKPFGALSVPMGFSRKRDTRERSILRVLQQEVYTKCAVNRTLSEEIIPEYARPFMFLDIVDVRVEIFHILLPNKLIKNTKFSSFKLENHRFVDSNKVLSIDPSNSQYRVGVYEAVVGFGKYRDYLERNIVTNAFYEKSILNKELAALAYDSSY